MALAVRQARSGDAEDVTALVRASYALYVPRMDREPAPMLADYATLIAGGHVVVAEEDGQLLGILVAYPRGDHLHVENVAVAPEGQARGTGRALMAVAEQQARQSGLAAIELYTNEVMEENFPFYARLGFAITGRTVEDGYNRVYFRKELESGP